MNLGLSCTIIFTKNECYIRTKVSFTDKFCKALSPKLHVVNRDESLTTLIDSIDTDLLYVVTGEVVCTKQLSRVVLPGLTTKAVRQTDAFYGGNTEYIKRLGSTIWESDDRFIRTLTEEETGIVSYKSSPTPGYVPGDTKILIGILSCCKYKGRRDACRNSWVKDLPKDCDAIFYVGSGYAEDAECEDMVQLASSDTYKNVPAKQMAFYRWAIDNKDFEWLFQVDDDTYVAPDRIFSCLIGNVEFIGQSFAKGLYHGGVGYFIHRSLLQEMITTNKHFVEEGNGDISFSLLAKSLGARVYNTTIGAIRYKYSGGPDKDNAWITTHYVDEKDMLKVHEEYKGNTKWSMHPENSIAVVGLFVGAYIGLLRDWYDNLCEHLPSDRAKKWFIVTDRSEEETRQLLPEEADVHITYHPRTNRAKMLMLGQVGLYMTSHLTEMYGVVLWAQANVRLCKSMTYNELMPDKVWGYGTNPEWAKFYDKNLDCKFARELPVNKEIVDWVVGGILSIKGCYVVEWSSYVYSRMLECVDNNMYFAAHNEQLLNRLAYCDNSTGTPLFPEHDTWIACSYEHCGIKYHKNDAAPEDEVIY